MLRLISILGLMLAMPLSHLAAAMSPQPGNPVLVVVLPWGGSAADVVSDAGGRWVGPTQAPMAVLAMLDDPGRALELGAFAVLDGAILAEFCGVSIG